MKTKGKLLMAAIIGNTLEFYDLALFGFLAPILSSYFFPNDNPTVSMMATLGAFAIGFIPRPLGAILFGHLGDRYGRKMSLMLSIILMAIPTLIIGLIPSYAQIGLLSPLLIIICRFFQGICIGGECNGSVIFFLEHYPGKRGFYGAIINSSAVLGFFLASIGTIVFTQPWMPSWGWRILFILGAVIALFGYYIRNDISETPEFRNAEELNEVKKMPLFEVFRTMPLAAILTIGVGGCMGGLALTLSGYMVTYLTKVVHLPIGMAMKLNFLAILWYLLFTPISGYISDKIGPYKVMLSATIITLVSAKIIYLLLSLGTIYGAIFGQLLLATLAATFLGPLSAFIYSIFPTSLRYSGIAFNFSLGLAIFGGMAPIISATLIYMTGNPISPFYYLITTSCIGMLSILGLKKRIDLANKNKSSSTTTELYSTSS